MYSIQLKLKSSSNNLAQLNSQKNTLYNSNNASSINTYNTLVNKYNEIVQESNKLSNQYNQLKDSYNNLVHQISPSTNVTFINCINSELLALETATMNQNLDFLNRNLENLKY
ncbi:hypothetical protein Sta7437_2912 [Stanieria cyanosphaera PCC 7437]|uniref:Uncharacterized protein n=1 Tax=Stanieria cyanosphaera (strain ATCC 29371 / PCC 7437) TaxID=111780 RepID=K9XWH2_STAC7|nr:hypothetical protein Sta7437_2912 [Stanieria cyanosphaera PCC 7437]